MSSPLPVLEREALRARQEAIYRDPGQWSESTPIMASSRLRCVLRYVTILERYQVPPHAQGLHGGWRILEPGCGIGSLSSVLAIFGEITSFDVSPHAIRSAQMMFGDLPRATFFEADGT